MELSLTDICEVVCSIQKAVGDFYGPQCSQTLLTSTTGKAVVTSDGYTVLEALQPAHPIAQLVFKALKSCHSLTLDGSKLFLLYLSNLLRQLSLEVNRGTFCHNGTVPGNNRKVLERHGATCARQNLKLIVQEVLPQLFEKIIDHSNSLARKLLQDASRSSVMKNVIKTCLMPHYSPKLSEHFAELLMASLSDSIESKHFPEMLSDMVEKFYLLCVKVPEKPYGSCTLVDMLLIRQKFVLKCENLDSSPCVGTLIVKGKLDGSSDTDEDMKTFSVSHRQLFVEFIHKKKCAVANLVQKCLDRGIYVILCSEGVPSYALDLFQEHKISVVAYTSEEDINMLEYISGKLALSSVYESIEDCHIISADKVGELTIGNQQLIQISVTNPFHLLKHLVICAPTVGLCDQLAIALQKALNSLKMSIEEPSQLIKSPTEVCEIDERLDDLQLAAVSVKKCMTNSDDLTTVGGSSEDSGGVVDAGKDNANAKLENSRGDFCLCLIEGGASFEILLAKLVSDYSKNCKDSNLASVCQVLVKSLQEVVHKLYDNTCIQPGSERNFLEVKTSLDRKLLTGELWGLDRRGVICNLAEKGVIEPLVCKIHVFECVLNLVDQLSGIDNIVSIRKIAQ